MLWVHDWLREMFDSTVVVHEIKLVNIIPKRPNWYLQFDQIILCRRGSLGGKDDVVCSGSFAWDRFRHAEEIVETLSQHLPL